MNSISHKAAFCTVVDEQQLYLQQGCRALSRTANYTLCAYLATLLLWNNAARGQLQQQFIDHFTYMKPWKWSEMVSESERLAYYINYMYTTVENNCAGPQGFLMNKWCMYFALRSRLRRVRISVYCTV